MREQFFVGQTRLDIVCTVGVNISGATAKIKYKKPDGTSGELDAIVTDDSIGEITHTVNSADTLDEAGDWIFWGYITFLDGDVAAGNPEKIRIYNEGEIYSPY